MDGPAVAPSSCPSASVVTTLTSSETSPSRHDEMLDGGLGIDAFNEDQAEIERNVSWLAARLLRAK